MNKKKYEDIKPFVSLIIIICTFFMVVFFKMEIRRLGYQVLKLNQTEKKIYEQQRSKKVILAKLTQPDKIEFKATSRLQLQEPKNNQIIILD